MIRIEIRRERNESQRGGDVVIQTDRRYTRFAAYYGTSPGSHIGFWRTRWTPLKGWNLRIGKRYTGPALTVFVHVNPERGHRP